MRSAIVSNRFSLAPVMLGQEDIILTAQQHVQLGPVRDCNWLSECDWYRLWPRTNSYHETTIRLDECVHPTVPVFAGAKSIVFGQRDSDGICSSPEAQDPATTFSDLLSAQLITVDVGIVHFTKWVACIPYMQTHEPNIP